MHLADLAAKTIVYQKGVSGFLGKSCWREAGVAMCARVLRSAWEARQVAVPLAGRPARQDFSPVGEER